jgi:Protein of unknown function (DUF3309)
LAGNLARTRKGLTVGLLLLIILVILLLGAWPAWPYSRGWGYRGPSLLGLVLVIVLVLILLRVIPWGWYP